METKRRHQTIQPSRTTKSPYGSYVRYYSTNCFVVLTHADTFTLYFRTVGSSVGQDDVLKDVVPIQRHAIWFASFPLTKGYSLTTATYSALHGLRLCIHGYKLLKLPSAHATTIDCCAIGALCV
jgi:hypothetical protein